eukprot:g83222.t1
MAHASRSCPRSLRSWLPFCLLQLALWLASGSLAPLSHFPAGRRGLLHANEVGHHVSGGLAPQDQEEDVIPISLLGIPSRCSDFPRAPKRSKQQWEVPEVMVHTSMATGMDMEPIGWIPNLGFAWTATVATRPRRRSKHLQPIMNQFGKEGSGYLEFIMAHYDCMPTATAFLHNHLDSQKHQFYANSAAKVGLEDRRQWGANPSVTNYDDTYADILRALCWERVESYWPLHNTTLLLTIDHPHFQAAYEVLDKFAPESLKLVYDEKVGFIYFCCGSFVVHRSAVVKHSKDWWEKLYEHLFQLDRREGGSLGVGYIIEYIWLVIFGDRDFLSQLWGLHNYQSRDPGAPSPPPYQLDISSLYACAPTSTQMQKEKARRNRIHKEVRLDKVRHEKQRVDMSEDPRLGLARCVRFVERGKVEQRRLYTHRDCTRVLEGHWRDMHGLTGRRDMGECYFAAGHGGFSSEDGLCDCLQTCRKQSEKTNACCLMSQNNTCGKC